ncbi:MAG: hypothetical protein ACR2J8_09590, partial [Thermomicrobiales bacterium]
MPGGKLVPLAMVMAMIALAVAAASMSVAVYWGRWWEAGIALAVLGGIIPMIQAVSIRVMPVFSHRSWPAPKRLGVQVALSATGSWLVWAGIVAEWPGVVQWGGIVALCGGLTMMANVVALVRQPVSGILVPEGDVQQVAADRSGRRFTQLAGMYLMLGLVVGVMRSFWTPGAGRWELVWAHSLLVGFFLSMAAGVSYHVLSRWTGKQWTHADRMA